MGNPENSNGESNLNKRGASQVAAALFGHCGLRTASEVRFDLKIELRDLNYPDIYCAYCL